MNIPRMAKHTSFRYRDLRLLLAITRRHVSVGRYQMRQRRRRLDAVQPSATQQRQDGVHVVHNCPSPASSDIPIHPWHSTQIPAVLLHPCCRHDVQTTIAVIFLPSLGRAAHPSLYSRQAGVFGLRPTSHQRRHSRPSDSASSRFCSLSLIWTFTPDAQSLHLCGPSNN